MQLACSSRSRDACCVFSTLISPTGKPTGKEGEAKPKSKQNSDDKSSEKQNQQCICPCLFECICCVAQVLARLPSSSIQYTEHAAMFQVGIQTKQIPTQSDVRHLRHLRVLHLSESPNHCRMHHFLHCLLLEPETLSGTRTGVTNVTFLGSQDDPEVASQLPTAGWLPRWLVTSFQNRQAKCIAHVRKRVYQLEHEQRRRSFVKQRDASEQRRLTAVALGESEKRRILAKSR